MSDQPLKHGAQHAADGPDPIPIVSASSIPWVLFDAGGQTLPGDNGFDPLLFDTLYWDPALVTLNPADPADGSDPIFAIDKLTFGGTDYFVFAARNGGWFEFDVEVELGNVDDGAVGKYAQMQMVASTFSGIPVQGYRRMGLFAEWRADGGSWLENDNHLWTTNRKMYVSDQQATYIPQVRQNTGADKDLSGMLWVGYYGTLGGSTLDSSDWESGSA